MKRVNKQWLLFVYVILCGSVFGQEVVPGTDYAHFQLSAKEGPIDFVVADTNLTTVKPVLLFCQGSQPVPLFLNFDEYGTFPVPLSNFDLKTMRDKYHVVVISMPGTPLVVGRDHLNHSYNYVTDTTDEYSYAPAFVEGDYLENYVDRANRVIRFLRKQKQWVDDSGIVLAGHSQGSRVAVAIAAENKHIGVLGLFGYNPMRRIDQLVWNHRKNAELGRISWEEADSLQQQEYAFYREIRNKDSLASSASLRSWQSFSTNSFETLAGLKIPVYVAYGSEDIVTDCNDLIPLYFIEQGKTDYRVVRYPYLEHNFFPVRDGVVDHEAGKWPEVMNAFIQWSEENRER